MHASAEITTRLRLDPPGAREPPLKVAEFIAIGGMEEDEVLRLAAGAEDTQSTHDEDEVYVVLKGRAELVVDGEEMALCEGSIVYVPADVPHEFVRIEEDLSLLVFFGSGGPSGAEV